MAGNSKPIAIKVSGLHRRFDSQQVLDGVDLECPRGEVTGRGVADLLQAQAVRGHHAYCGIPGCGGQHPRRP